MQLTDLAREYQSKTDDELLRLAIHPEQLTSEAQASLTAELLKRGIDPARVSAHRQQDELRRAGMAQPSPTIPSAPLVPGKDVYIVGPSLPAETPKAPWRPRVAGRIAFFFGPLAGAQVVAISLRRMGHRPAAAKVMRLALGFVALEAVILFFVSEGIARLVGFAGEIGFMFMFPKFMANQFDEWEAAHPSAVPSNGWSAVGWGVLGALAFFLAAFAVMFALALLFPNAA